MSDERTAAASATREQLLDAGLALLAERGLTIGLDRVRLADAAERAGYTTGAAYNLWGSARGREGGGQEAFRRELAVRALERLRSAIPNNLGRLAAEVMQPGVGLDEVMREMSNRHLEAVRERHAEFAVLVGLFAAGMAGGEAIEGAARRFDLAYHAQTREQFGDALVHFGLAVRPPFEIEHLVACVTALFDGMVIHGTFLPEVLGDPVALAGPDGKPQEWSMLAVCVKAIVDRMVGPAGG